MATAALPRSPRSLIGKLAVAIAARRAARGRRPSAVAAFAAKAREHVVTIAALSAFDIGAFQLHIPHAGAAPGWIAVCVSLLALNFAVED